MTSRPRPVRAMRALPAGTSNRTQPETPRQRAERGFVDSTARRRCRQDLRRARDHHKRAASITGRPANPRPLGPARSKPRAHQRSIRARRHRCRPRGRILLRRLPLHLMVGQAGMAAAASPELSSTSSLRADAGVSCEDGSDLMCEGRCADAKRSSAPTACRQRPMLRSTGPFERWRGYWPGRPRVKSSTAPRAAKPTVRPKRAANESCHLRPLLV